MSEFRMGRRGHGMALAMDVMVSKMSGWRMRKEDAHLDEMVIVVALMRGLMRFMVSPMLR
jgi:hypothetical protein